MKRCSVCPPKPNVNKVVDFKVQQFYKENNCGKTKVYPKTITHAVEDICTGKSLYNILGEFNHKFLLFDSNIERTLLNVPIPERRTGMVVTFNHPKEGNKTLRFDGNPVTEWNDLDKWTEAFVDNKWFIPANLRTEGNSIKLDIVNELGEIVDTLCTTIPVSNISAFNTVVVDKLPKPGNPDTIYLFREGNSHIKYIWVPQLNRYEQLGTIIINKGVCGTSVRVLEDKYISNIRIDGNNLIVDRNDGEELSVTLPTTTVPEVDSESLKELKKRIEDLENKEDKDTDTVFDPSELNTAIQALKDKIDELQRELDSKPDVDTNTDTDTNTFIKSGEWITDDHIRITLNDGSIVDIKKNITPIQPKLPLEVEITPNNLEGFDSVNTSFNIVAKRGNTPIEATIKLNDNPYTSGDAITYTENTPITIVVEEGEDRIEKQFNVRVTPTTYTLIATPERVTINKGEVVTISTRIISNNPLANTTGFEFKINEQPFNNGQVSPNETTTYIITAERNDITLRDTVEVVVRKEVVRHKIYYGYHRTTNIGEYATTNDTTEFIEVDNLPATIEWGTHEEDIYGYWGLAVPKEIAPNINKIQMKVNNDYLDVSGGYSVESVQIDSIDYWFIKDLDIEEINPIGIKVF